MDDRTPIHIPVFQKFDCHSCGYCCRNLVVNVSSKERQKIYDAGWEQRIPDQPLFAPYRYRGRRLYRLSQRPDGRCVFLGNDERCRLHAETGVGSKPLACRMYPFVPTPGADSVRLDFRMDCPSVASNKGRALTIHRTAIDEYGWETGTRKMASLPPWRGARRLSVTEFEALVGGFDQLLAKGSMPIRGRFRAACLLLDLLYTVRIAKVRDARFIDLIELLSTTVIDESVQSTTTQPVTLPKRAGRLFRQWLFLHAVSDDPRQLDASYARKMMRSWKRYFQARRFANGTGPVPLVRKEWPVTDFESLSNVERGDDATLEPLWRSLRLKLDAHAFAGPSYFGYDLMSGLTALWLLPALTGWFARLEAVSHHREQLTGEDVLAGLQRAHHTFGVSPVFVRISERLRLRALARVGVPLALLDEYGP